MVRLSTLGSNPIQVIWRSLGSMSSNPDWQLSRVPEFESHSSLLTMFHLSCSWTGAQGLIHDWVLVRLRAGKSQGLNPDWQLNRVPGIKSQLDRVTGFESRTCFDSQWHRIAGSRKKLRLSSSYDSRVMLSLINQRFGCQNRTTRN